MTGTEGKMEEETTPNQPATPELTQEEKKSQGSFDMISFDLSILETSDQAKDNKVGIKIVRHLKFLRRNLSIPQLKKLWATLAPSLTAPAFITSEAGQTENNINVSDNVKNHPYTQIYLKTLTVSWMLLNDQYNEIAQQMSWQLVEDSRNTNNWILDHFWSHIYYIFARAQERTNQLNKARVTFFELYRTSSLSKNTTSQAMLLNLILRCFLSTNDFKGASEFIKHTLFPENKVNNEFVKYLYYTARIKAVELGYKEAFTRVTQAIRKSPETAALGFRVAAEKLAIVVEMLMGDIPSRQRFVEGEVSKYLYPYYELTRSLVKGEVKTFEQVINKYQTIFEQDGNLILIKRLTLNVIRAGLKRINLSYSRIAFGDIRTKLGLPDSTDVESMVAKAIRDGVITARIDFKTQHLFITENNDVYSTKEPQINFQKRIEYCTNLITNCNGAMQYKQAVKEENKEIGGDDEDDEENLEKLMEAFEDEFM